MPSFAENILHTGARGLGVAAAPHGCWAAIALSICFIRPIRRLFGDGMMLSAFAYLFGVCDYRLRAVAQPVAVACGHLSSWER